MVSCLSFFVGASTGVVGTLIWQKKGREKTEDVLPDLVAVHTKVSSVSGRTSRASDLRYLRLLPSDAKRKWMFYLMPVWNWHDNPPKAAEFWKLAHAVSRDQQGDDWIAPHVTLHSRVSSLQGLIEKFEKLLTDLGRGSWKDVLEELQHADNWIFDDDTQKERPTNAKHHVVHKARIKCPDHLRTWLTVNEGDMLCKPRKKELHISLYSFRVRAIDLSIDELTLSPSACRAPSYVRSDPRVAHHTPAAVNDIRQDLTRADWTLVLMSSGRTDSYDLAPQILSAVKLSDLASGAWRQ